MQVNATDFQRNFRNSFYGLIVTPDVVKAASRESVKTTLNGVLPAHHPKFPNEKEFIVNALIPTDEPDTFSFWKLVLPWKEDMDTNKSVMLSGVPVTGMIQAGDACVYISRSPIREPTAYGYWPDAHTIYNPWADINPIQINSQRILWRIFNPIRYLWPDAVNLINNGERIGCPIDRFLALGALKNRRFTQIFFKNKNVGFINENNIPVMFLEHRSVFLVDYIHKLSGVHPIIK